MFHSHPETEPSPSRTDRELAGLWAGRPFLIYGLKLQKLRAWTITREDVAELEGELSRAISRIDAGEFVPTPGEFTCAGCPALDRICAGPRLHCRSGSEPEPAGFAAA